MNILYFRNLIVMKKMLFLLLAIAFMDCQKNERSDYQCVNTVIYSSPGFLPDTVFNTNYYRNRTSDEMSIVIHDQTYTGRQEYQGRQTYVTSRCACGIGICPE